LANAFEKGTQGLNVADADTIFPRLYHINKVTCCNTALDEPKFTQFGYVVMQN